MTSLRTKMADNGFESNESYEYVVKCLLSNPNNSIRCLNIEGDSGRRKTAFANALANSLDAEHVIYHDFSQEEEIKPAIVVNPNTDEDEGKEEPPVEMLDRVLSDACAFSEAETTILILDQLQAADFKEHIRLYKFLINKEWSYRNVSFFANQQNLRVFVISEEPVYHSLQKHSFKVWVSTASSGVAPYKPEDFGLEADAEQMMRALGDVFTALNAFPTPSEYKKIIHDINHNVRTPQELCHSIYGWTEGIERDALLSKEIQTLLKKVMPIIEDYIGIEEAVELTAAHIPNESIH